MPPSKEQTAAATGPGRAPKLQDMPAPPVEEITAPVNGENAADRKILTEALAGLAPTMVPASPALPTTAKVEAPSVPTTAAPAPGPANGFGASGAAGASYTPTAGETALASEATQDAAAAYARPSRVPITPERLLAAMQPNIEKAAETAMLTAVTKYLSPAVHNAINSIDAARDASVKQIEESFAQQRSTVVHSSREELLARLEDRLDEVRSRWDGQLDGYRVRAEEIVQRIDRQAGAAQKNLGDAREVSDRAVRDAQMRINTVATQALAEALREFDQGIKLASHRQLTQVLEEVQSLTKEATAHLESNVAEARATVQTAAAEALGEFRRQAEIHATVTAADTNQRVTSALASLDAEHRAACDERRHSIQEDINRSTQQVTEQFRQGLRAFFYSCLVAAVGAVEQHSQATRDGLDFDPGKFLPPDEK